MRKKNMLGNGGIISTALPVASMTSEEIRQKIIDDTDENPRKLLRDYIDELDQQLEQTYSRNNTNRSDPAYTDFIRNKDRVVNHLKEGLIDKRRRGSSGIIVYLDNSSFNIPTPPVQKQDLLIYLEYIDKSFDDLYRNYSININQVGSLPHLSEQSSIVIRNMPGGRRHKKRTIRPKKNKRNQRKTRRRIKKM